MIHITDKSQSGFMSKMAMGKGDSTGQKKNNITTVLSSVHAIDTCPSDHTM